MRCAPLVLHHSCRVCNVHCSVHHSIELRGAQLESSHITSHLTLPPCCHTCCSTCGVMAKYLPPKVEQVVFCKMSALQVCEVLA